MGGILTLSELQKYTDAFNDFTTVEGSNLDPYYKGIFPHKCQCGAEIIMTATTAEQEGYTQLQCCNPDCWIKMAHRFVYFAKTLGFKGFGSAGALPMYRVLHEKFRFPTFLCIFEMSIRDIEEINGQAYASEFEAMRTALKQSAWPFKDAIAALGIPDVGKNCSIFDVVKGPVVFLDLILKDRIDELCNMAGIHAEKTRYFLTMSKVDIVTLMADVMPHIVSTPKKEVYVAITGSVTVDHIGMTRAEFIWKCEAILDKQGEPAYKLVETKSESKVQYVIADTPSGSSKYQLGVRTNRLITADKFYHMLLNEAEGGSSNE